MNNPSQQIEEKCENCIFFRRSDCRRFPPFAKDLFDNFHWPTVNKWDWCGEFIPEPDGEVNK